MQRIVSWVKNLRPLKILTVFLAGVFLLIAQACNRPDIAAQPSQPGAQPPNAQRYDPTKSYEVKTPYEGGINNFSDVDPRSKATEKAADAQAKALSDNARKNVEQKGIDSPDQYVENFRQGTPLGERVKRLGENISNSVEDVRQGVSEGTQRGIENIQENTQQAAKDLTKNVQRATEDAGKNIQRSAEDAAASVNRAVKSVD
ncbi:DUF6658 family protein [Fortiea contorta]|uniref:DUF6658 family protein n=1 Tax=Fortiea contorta TaxID=1892405 RepID=UPI0003449EBB|nr:DUF6658 family protein [Fortiea contorta]